MDPQALREQALFQRYGEKRYKQALQNPMLYRAMYDEMAQENPGLFPAFNALSDQPATGRDISMSDAVNHMARGRVGKGNAGSFTSGRRAGNINALIGR